jgi:hypothetical protein
VYELLVKPASSSKFIKNKIAIFFVRDPRDILVSSYYSFGFTHGFSSLKIVREQEIARRKEIQEKTLDEYVIQSADAQVKYFETLWQLSKDCEQSIIIKYEDMINDFDKFSKQLCKYVILDDNVMSQIYQKTRPKEKENISAHRRSGKVKGFENKLNKNTIDILNKKLSRVLDLFEYE